jgi:UDP-3-O-[3-hydroxymyristoyl] N-acetylglucosamine deacetylase
MGIDNALIDVHGPEIPVMDGSAKVFTDAIDAVGTVHSSEPRRRYIPAETRLFRDAEKLLVVAPSSGLRIRFTVDYAEPIGSQYLDEEITPEFYREQIAPARTFGFLHEVESLIRRGLAQGGSLENAIVFGPEGPLTPLRLEGEVVRHKILDLIGDFTLLGAWPQCEVISIKSGHKLHCTCVRELERDIEFSPAAAVGP